MAGNDPTLILRLLARLVDMHGYLERFAAAAKAGAAHWRGAEVIQADRDPHMGFGNPYPIGRVEADPAEVLDMASTQAWPASCAVTPSTR